MLGLIKPIFCLVLDLFRSRATLEAEILVLRQQIIVLRRGRVGRLPFSASDRLVLGWVCGLFPNTRDALAIIRPESVMRWHRAGFRSYWRWKSRRRPGRPAVSDELRQLIREMSIANPLWGAPRIHGELLKIGIDVGQTSVAKYMARRRGPPSQGWKTFLLNHADGIAAMDLFVVPTVSFRLLYGLLIMGHSRRRILWLGVTAHPTAEWLANQLTQAFGWKRPLDYLIRDRDACYGNLFVRRVRSLGIRDRPTSPRSPWQNGWAARRYGRRSDGRDVTDGRRRGTRMRATCSITRAPIFRPTRIICAMPRALLRSLLLICADSAAFICRVSTQITGKPASANALYSHCDKGPASRPMRSMASASSVRTARIATGLVATLTSRITLPALSTMHTLVSFTETSNPT